MPFGPRDGEDDVMGLFDFVTHVCGVFYVVFVFVRRPLSPSNEGQSLSNENEFIRGSLFVKCFFDAGKKKDSAPCHLVTGA